MRYERRMPIYQKFVEQAKKLEPRYLAMVIPSRWFAGGQASTSSASEMLADERLRALVDYPDAHDVFPGVEIEGGVSYFLWDATIDGPVRGHHAFRGRASTDATLTVTSMTYDIFVRYNEAVPILEKVVAVESETDVRQPAEPGRRPIQPFGLRDQLRGVAPRARLTIPCSSTRTVARLHRARRASRRNDDWVDQWKVFYRPQRLTAQADRDAYPHRILSRRFVGDRAPPAPRPICHRSVRLRGEAKASPPTCALGLCASLSRCARTRSTLHVSASRSFPTTDGSASGRTRCSTRSTASPRTKSPSSNSMIRPMDPANGDE